MPSSNPTVRQSARHAGLLAHAGATGDHVRHGTERQDARSRHHVVPRLLSPQYRNARPRVLGPAVTVQHQSTVMTPCMSFYALPELDLADFMARPAERGRRASSSRGCATRVTAPGSVISSGHGVPAGARCGDHGAGAREFFALPREPSGARSRSRTRRTFAATPCSATNARRASATGASNSTSGRRSRRLRVRPGEPAVAAPARAEPMAGALPAMRPTVLEWMRAMDRVGLAVLRALALGLGPAARLLRRRRAAARRSAFEDHSLPGAERATPSTGQGVGMHHDSGLVSFVLQDDVGGLQVELDGRLVDATPKPGTYVMNLGEMLQAATRGYLRATKHRVQSPPSGRERVLGRVLLPSAARRRVRADRAAARARGRSAPAARTPIRTTRSSRPSATTT